MLLKVLETVNVEMYFISSLNKHQYNIGIMNNAKSPLKYIIIIIIIIFFYAKDWAHYSP